MSYGAHKRIVELLISDYSRRGFIDGCSLRLPGVVARPSQPSGLLSAFMSDALRELAAGRPFEFPVAGNGDRLVDVARVRGEKPSAGRAFGRTCPAIATSVASAVLHASMLQIVEAVADVYGQAVRRNASFAPNAQIQAQFASCPPLRCPSSIEAGFQHDGTLRELVQRALA